MMEACKIHLKDTNIILSHTIFNLIYFNVILWISHILVLVIGHRNSNSGTDKQKGEVHYSQVETVAYPRGEIGVQNPHFSKI